MYTECRRHQARVLEQRFPELPKVAVAVGALVMVVNFAVLRSVRHHQTDVTYNGHALGTNTAQAFGVTPGEE